MCRLLIVIVKNGKLKCQDDVNAILHQRNINGNAIKRQTIGRIQNIQVHKFLQFIQDTFSKNYKTIFKLELSFD